MRAVLVLICLALAVLAAVGVRRAWRSRLARQAQLPALPVIPGELGPARLHSTGQYVGSTFAGSWQDRVVHGGLGEPADAAATLHEAGVLVRRQGNATVFVPQELWRGARLAPGLAGKAAGDGGLFVLRWQLGTALVDTGFRADDTTTYPQWVHAINGKVSA